MNIFVLDRNPEMAAIYHCDEHVGKMVVEYAQILSTVQRMYGNQDPALYRPTHVKHICVRWAAASVDNYCWLFELWDHLRQEFEYRRGKTHASYELLKDVLDNIPNMPRIGSTPFAQAMPLLYRQRDAVEAYRDFYRYHKIRFATWTHPAEIPDWMFERKPTCLTRTISEYVTNLI